MKAILLIILVALSLSGYGQRDSSSLQEFTVENIAFNSAGVKLAGTIVKPQHAEAALVIVHGSGQEKRMLKMAYFLARNSITVFTYDKRGVGESEGIYAGPEVGTNNIDSANLTLLALDASAAANTLLAHLPANHGPLGLLGFSQAGWVIPIAAKNNNHINFMVLFSGPVVSTLEQLRFQFYTAGDARFWETHTEADAREHIRTDIDRYKFTDTNPVNYLSKLSIPGLWLFGGKDVQAPVNLSIEQLRLLKAKGKPYQYELFQDLGHNTAFSNTAEPVNGAFNWVRLLKRSE